MPASSGYPRDGTTSFVRGCILKPTRMYRWHERRAGLHSSGRGVFLGTFVIPARSPVQLLESYMSNLDNRPGRDDKPGFNRTHLMTGLASSSARREWEQ